MTDYQRIIDYDFTDIVLDNKLVIKFKIERNIEEWQLLSMFSFKKGERFVIKTPETKETIVGIGYEYSWQLESNDFLKVYDNISIISDFENLKEQITTIDIDNYTDDYFGLYGGISDGNNKNSQEWVDFSDTMFVIPSIVAVFREDYIYFTLFFNMKKEDNFISLWKDRILFLEKIQDNIHIELKEPKISVVRDIYPEVWQDNIKLALSEMEKETFSRIVLSRKNQILLESKTSLGAITKYLLNRKKYFIAFESKKSMFLTTNPLISLDITGENMSTYLYLKQENLFTDKCTIIFEEEDIIRNYKYLLEEKLGKEVTVENDKFLIGKKIDVYSVYKAIIEDKEKAIKTLSLIYPVQILKGYPQLETEQFLKNHENMAYGFWYAPVGYINSNLDAKFYTCSTMLVSFENIITMFTNILLSKDSTYDKVLERTDTIVSNSLKLFE